MRQQRSKRASKIGRKCASSTSACRPGDLGVDASSAGFEVCRRIKRDPRTSRIPVIFLTALNDTMDRVQAIEAGGEDFLTKPHNSDCAGRARAQPACASRRRRMRWRTAIASCASWSNCAKISCDDRARPQNAADEYPRHARRCSPTVTSVRWACAVKPCTTRKRRRRSCCTDRGHARGRAHGERRDRARSWNHCDLRSCRRDHERLGARLEQEGARVTLEVARDAPAFRGDAKLLKRVFGNLLRTR